MSSIDLAARRAFRAIRYRRRREEFTSIRSQAALAEALSLGMQTAREPYYRSYKEGVGWTTILVYCQYWSRQVKSRIYWTTICYLRH